MTLVRLVVSPGEVDMVSDLLWQLGCTGIAELAAADSIELTAGFDGAAPIDHLARRGFAATTVEPFDWVEAQGEFLGPVEVGPVTIVPSTLLDVTTGAAAPSTIVIDPGAAFGHGGHPTTRLAVDLLARLVKPGLRVLDIGSGTGVLSIVAARLGAAEVVAVEIDAAARTVTAENATRNGVAVTIYAHLDEVPSTFDIAVANVTIDVHESIALAVRSRASTVIVSGVLDGQSNRALTAYGGAVVCTSASDGWTAFAIGA